jgi:tetratricopeptide (TPR) repeat protein
MRRSVSRGYQCLLVSGLLVATPVMKPVLAQVRDAAGGEALFQEGRRLMKTGDFAGACPKLEESLRLDPALGTLVNLASCEEELGHTATAWQHWRSAIEQLPSSDKRRATAVARAAALEKVLPHLAVAAPQLPSDAEVKRDGVRLGTASLGLPMPVDPGRHLVVVTAPGHEPREYEVSLRARENQTLTVEAGAEVKVARPLAEAAPERWSDPEPKSAAAVTSEPTTGRGTSVAGWTLLTTGVASLAAGGLFGLRALSARKDAQKSCPGSKPSVCWTDGKSALDRDRTSSLIADVGMGLGVVLMSAGLYLVLRRPGGEVSAQAAPLPGGAAFRLAGSF